MWPCRSLLPRVTPPPLLSHSVPDPACDGDRPPPLSSPLAVRCVVTGLLSALDPEPCVAPSVVVPKPSSSLALAAAEADAPAARRRRQYQAKPTAASAAHPSTEPTTAHTQEGVPPPPLLSLLLPLLPPLVLLSVLLVLSELKHSEVTASRM